MNSKLQSPPVFGQWLKRLRAQHDLTQETLAEQVACSVQTIRFFETGKRRPSLEMAERLADVLDVPPDQRAQFVRQARTALIGDESSASAEGIMLDVVVTETPVAPPPPPVAPSPPQLATARLPLPATILVGRQPEYNVLRQLLVEDGCRLVSLVGPGGIGKTRLALHVAHELQSHFSNSQFSSGALFVSLVSITSASELPSAIAAALNVTLAGEGTPASQLDRLLGGQSLLLVLDNFEHLLALEDDGAVALIDHILQHLEGIQLLVTTRERLRLAGEHVFELDGLSVPTSGLVSDEGDQVIESEAVLLFLQRARQVSPSFALTPTNHAAIARICTLLGGMPLGIELAAAWVRMLTTEEIVAEMARSLDFLTRADRGAPPRHRSLRAVFEHSWTLLTAGEQRAVAQLSIFRGGFRREAAQAVAGAGLAELAALIDKSLVRTTSMDVQRGSPLGTLHTQANNQAPGAVLRYDIHELLRQFLQDKLHALDDEQSADRRHAEYFVTLAEQVEARLYEDQSAAWLSQLEAEQGNIRAALEWSLEGRHAPILGLRLVGALGRYWYLNGPWIEGCDWLRLALAQAGNSAPPQLRAKALVKLGELLHSLSEQAEARACMEEGIALWREQGDAKNLAWALFQLGILAATVGNHAEAESLMNESVERYRALNAEWHVATVLMQLAGTFMQYGDYGRTVQILNEVVPIFRRRQHAGSMGVALNFLGWANLEQGNFTTAIAQFNEVVPIGRSFGNGQLIGWSLRNLGMAYLLAHDWPRARENLHACLQIYQRISFRSGIVIALEGVAALVAEQGEMVEAVKWLAVTEQLRISAGQPRALVEERLNARTRQLTSAALSPEVWQAAWDEGTNMPLELALAQILQG